MIQIKQNMPPRTSAKVTGKKIQQSKEIASTNFYASMESCHCESSLISAGRGRRFDKGLSPRRYLYGYLPSSMLTRARFCLMEAAYFAGTSPSSLRASSASLRISLNTL
jgi:hypothetical protein